MFLKSTSKVSCKNKWKMMGGERGGQESVSQGSKIEDRNDLAVFLFKMIDSNLHLLIFGEILYYQIIS